MSFSVVRDFERKVAQFYNSPYAVAVDCCTHALELCLRLQGVQYFTLPKRTYLSVPFLSHKLNIDFDWRDEDWSGYYYLGGTNIIDAAVFWEKNGYVPETFMCLSFQHKKHLSLGRGGMILTDNFQAANDLRKMSYDGRVPDIPWREQNVEMVGYHYYMTPETAKFGLEKLSKAISNTPRKWKVTDWPDLTEMEIFK